MCGTSCLSINLDPSQPRPHPPHPARLTVVTNDLDGIEDYLPPPQRFVVGLPPLAELHEVGMKRRRASRMMMLQQQHQGPIV